MERSDSELIEACLRRDAQAWQELVARYSRLVYSIPRRKGLTPEDADDVFQNVFTIIYRQLPKLREHQALPAWIITITQRQCYRLRSRVQQEVELDEAGLNLPADSDDPVQTWERQHLVQQALDQLDPRCRELLTALFLDEGGESYKTIAQRLQIPIGSIGPVRGRCFKKLESILDALGIDSLQ